MSWEALGSHGRIMSRVGQLWSHVSDELERRDWRLGGQGEGWGEGVYLKLPEDFRAKKWEKGQGKDEK